jgi:hypothetical protein
MRTGGSFHANMQHHHGFEVDALGRGNIHQAANAYSDSDNLPEKTPRLDKIPLALSVRRHLSKACCLPRLDGDIRFSSSDQLHKFRHRIDLLVIRQDQSRADSPPTRNFPKSMILIDRLI